MKRFLKFVLVLTVLTAILTGFGWAALFATLPNPDTVYDNLHPPSIRITDRHGRTLYEVLPENAGRNHPVSLDEIPLALQQATIATEDRTFYENPGVDLAGIIRAAWINAQGGETVAGGSTLTQQVARNLLLTENERTTRTFSRKLREAALAYQLSQRFTKDEILALYLNQMNYGGMAYGVEAAARVYFGKPVASLDLAESALLAGLPQAPALYNPFLDPDAAKQRQEIVLGLIEKAGYINPEARALAVRETLIYNPEPYPIHAPHFVMMVSAALDEILPPDARAGLGALTVQTTLDLDWQTLAESAVARQMLRLQQTSPDDLGYNVNNAALVALSPQSGEVMALVGSIGYFDSEHSGAINMALAPRQPGSALKPLIYAAALDPATPNPWTAGTMLLDVTTAFPTHDGQPYLPKNYDGLEHGPVSVRDALASSLNIPAVMALEKVGVANALALLKSVGVTTLHNPETYDLSLALGGGEVRLLELTAAYAALANGGNRTTPVSILRVTTTTGEDVYVAPTPSVIPVLDQRVTWLVSDVLSDDDARALGFGANSALKIDRPAAVKTGTTTGFHDNWTVGYTPNLVVGVWVGNSDHEPMRNITGLTGAAPIWHQFMRAALVGSPPVSFAQPEGMVQAEICARSGMLLTAACPFTRREWYIASTVPTRADTLYHRVPVDAQTGLMVDAFTPSEQIRVVTALDLPPSASNWARVNSVYLLNDLLPNGNAQGMRLDAPMEQGALRILSPPHNTTYVWDASLPADAQRVRVQISAAQNFDEVQLWIDGELVKAFDAAPYVFWWTLNIGQHELEAIGVRAGARVENVSIRVNVLEE